MVSANGSIVVHAVDHCLRCGRSTVQVLPVDRAGLEYYIPPTGDPEPIRIGLVAVADDTRISLVRPRSTSSNLSSTAGVSEEEVLEIALDALETLSLTRTDLTDVGLRIVSARPIVVTARLVCSADGVVLLEPTARWGKLFTTTATATSSSVAGGTSATTAATGPITASFPTDGKRADDYIEIVHITGW